MSINKQSLRLLNVSEDDFLKWCKKNKKPKYKVSSKEEFFEKILKNKLIKDSKSGELIEK